MDMCVRHFKQASGRFVSCYIRLKCNICLFLNFLFFGVYVCVLTGCSVEEALEAASLHPAQLLGISNKKGNLDYGSDAGQDTLQR